MNHHNTHCGDASLQDMLRFDRADGDVHSDEMHGAEAHIECCSECQSRLASLAAKPGDWSLVQESLLSDDAEGTRGRWIAGRWPDLPSAWTDSMARQLLAPPSHPEMLGRIGRYEVERLIGSGGMGVVFKAFDTELNRPVAVKVLAPYLAGNGAARKRFAREARAAAAVVHEHVVPIHNVESEGESPFLVMHYIAGESLQQRLDREGPLELCEILRIGMQTATGLAAAHAQGLIHRDVKPSNILLEQGVERTLLTDFGLARASDDASMTRSGYHPGTPQYMSPEQARGEAVDQRSDLFSLGSVLYALCTGRPPFRAETSYGILRRITDEEPRPIREINPDIPAWLCSVVAKLMAKQSEARFASAVEVAELLEACLAHVQRPATSPLPPSLNCQRRHKLVPLRSPVVLGVLAMTSILAATLIGLAFLGADNLQDTGETNSAEKSAESSPIDKALLPKVSKEFRHETQILNGLVTGGGIIERIEDKVIHLSSGDSFTISSTTVFTMRPQGARLQTLKFEWLEPGMVVSYSLQDGKTQRIHLVGIAELSGDVDDVFRRIKELSLRKGGQVSTGIDGRAPMRIVGSEGETLIKIGETKLIKLPKPTTAVEWRVGEFAPESVEDIEPFDYLLVQWRANGRVTWTCYQSPGIGQQSEANAVKESVQNFDARVIVKASAEAEADPVLGKLLQDLRAIDLPLEPRKMIHTALIEVREKFVKEDFLQLMSPLVLEASRIYIEMKPNDKDVVTLLLNEVSAEELDKIRKLIPETETRLVRCFRIQSMSQERAAASQRIENIASTLVLLETNPDARDGATRDARLATAVEPTTNRTIGFGKGSGLVIDGTTVDVHVVGMESVIVETAGRRLRWKIGEAYARAVEIEAPGSEN